MRLPPNQVKQRQQAIERAQQLVKQGLAGVRRAVQALRPVALETFALPEAIAALIREFEPTAGIQVMWQVEGQVVPLAPRFALPPYRAAQEALTNVRKHAANAQRVRLQLRHDAESITLRAENDGVTPAASSEGGYGLRGLRERADALGGTFQAGPDASGGFCMEMTVPKGCSQKGEGRKPSAFILSLFSFDDGASQPMRPTRALPRANV